MIRAIASASLLTLLSLHVNAQPVADEPYPSDPLPCVVVSGLVPTIRPTDSSVPGIQKFYTAIGREASDALVQAIRDRRREVVPLFSDPAVQKDPPPDPPESVELLALSRCAKLVQIAFVSNKDESGPYLGYDVSVLHFVKRTGPDGVQSLRGVQEFERKYHRPRTAEELDRFVPKAYGEQIADDLFSSGVMPGVRSAEDVFEHEVRMAYDKVRLANRGNEYLVRHVLVATEPEALRVLERIRGGESFEAVAREVSRDPESARKGGSLGWNNANFFPPEFEAALPALAPKGMTGVPVKTRWGWHVIEVEETRPRSFPTYEEVHDRLAARVREKQAAARAASQ